MSLDIEAMYKWAEEDNKNPDSYFNTLAKKESVAKLKYLIGTKENPI